MTFPAWTIRFDTRWVYGGVVTGVESAQGRSRFRTSECEVFQVISNSATRGVLIVIKTS